MDIGCSRCNKLFGSYNALEQHVRDSSRHHECPECNFDGRSWEALLDHCRQTDCRSVCQGCNGGHGSHWTFSCAMYWDHVDQHNVCCTCERHFETPANLEAHNLTHYSADVDCLACNRLFTTYGGMIIHLESGSCDAGIDIIDLNQAAVACDWWEHYIDRNYHNDLMNRRDLSKWYKEKVYPYRCPTCGTVFPKLSSLFQYVESSACSQTLNSGAISRLMQDLDDRYGST